MRWNRVSILKSHQRQDARFEAEASWDTAMRRLLNIFCLISVLFLGLVSRAQAGTILLYYVNAATDPWGTTTGFLATMLNFGGCYFFFINFCGAY